MRSFSASGRLWALLCLLTAALAAHAQGGPPFRTDDPGTPGNGHWELNIGFVGQRNPASGAYQVPDFDLNYGLGDRLQLKYEVPIAIEETRPQPATKTDPAVPGQVIGGLGASYPGIKWRFYEHKPGKSYFSDGAFGTGLLALFGHKGEQKQPAESAEAGKEGAVGEQAREPEPDLAISTYPQLSLNNPTSAVRRGLVASGPNFYLPIEVNGTLGWLAYNFEIGYNFGNQQLPQSWGRGLLLGHAFTDRTEAYVELYDQQDANRVPAGRGVGNFATGLPKQRQTTVGLGGRQALNKAKTLNLLLLGERAFQAISASNSQPSWVAYVGVQILWGGKDEAAAQQPEVKAAPESKR